MVIRRSRRLVVCIGLAGIVLVTAICARKCVAAEKSGPKANPALKNLTRTSPTGVALDSRVDWLPDLRGGQRFIKLADGRIMTVAGDQVCVTADEGKTWDSWPLFPSPREDIQLYGSGGWLLRTRGGAIILVLMNKVGMKWGWNDATNLPAPDARLAVWSIRSLDEGKTWVDAQEIYGGYCGAICHVIQTSNGNVVVGGQELLYEQARHAIRPYVSADDGKTWTKGNLIDLGGRGHHDGAMEATLVELRDGRLWMLIRTTLDQFWSAYSQDQGLTWRVIGPSGIDASSAPGYVARLASGRLVLVWNRLYPAGLSAEEQAKYPRMKFGGSHAATAESYQRQELSIAFSSDDGATWTEPAVIARNPKSNLSYPAIFEPRPGRFWITTGQGDLRLGLSEADFVQ